MTIKTIVAASDSPTDHTMPIVVDLGKTRSSRIKSLKKGQGKLMQDVQEVMDQVRASLGERAQGVQLVPVVMIYKKKPKRRTGLFGM
jgi:hypothetical protein